MRTLPLHDALAAQGMTLRPRHGVEIPQGVTDVDTEYRYIREALGVTDMSHMQVYRFPEESGIDFLDSVMAGNVARIRFGRALHTFIADENGMLLADCYVANGDEELVVVAESIIDDAALDAVLLSAEGLQAGGERLTGAVAALSVDGVKAWAVVKELFGSDVLGLPYLSIERYDFGGHSVRLIRAGKTSEFGYQMLTPLAAAGELFEALLAAARKNNGGLCGVPVHDQLRLEGRFFNIYAEGAAVRDPLVLGLQWMIDFDKGAFRGSEAIGRRRAAGLQRKIIGVAGAKGATELCTGGTIYDEQGSVAEVVASCWSPALQCRLALAVFPVSCAFSGLNFHLGSSLGPELSTISMPPIVPRSLSVRLDEL